MDDPESVAGNSSGSFEELFRSFGALGRDQPSVGISLPGAGPRGSLSFRRYPAGARSVLNLKILIMSMWRPSQAALWSGRVTLPAKRSQVILEPTVCMSFLQSLHIHRRLMLSPDFRSMAAGRAPAYQTNTISKMTQNFRVCPVHVFLVPFVVCIISQLSCAVAPSAGAVLPGV